MEAKTNCERGPYPINSAYVNEINYGESKESSSIDQRLSHIFRERSPENYKIYDFKSAFKLAIDDPDFNSWSEESGTWETEFQGKNEILKRSVPVVGKHIITCKDGQQNQCIMVCKSSVHILGNVDFFNSRNVVSCIDSQNRRIAMGRNNGSISIWSLDGSLPTELKFESRGVLRMTNLPNGRFAMAFYDKHLKINVAICSLGGCEIIHKSPNYDSLNCMMGLSDGRFITSTSFLKLCIWSPDCNEPVIRNEYKKYGLSIQCMIQLPDDAYGVCIAMGDSSGKIHLLSLDSDREPIVIGPRRELRSNDKYCCMVYLTGGYIVTSFEHEMIHIGSLKGEKILSINVSEPGKWNVVTCMTLLADNTSIAMGCLDGTVKILSLKMSGDGKLSWDGTITCLIEKTNPSVTGKDPRKPLRNPLREITSIKFFDGNLVTVSRDNKIRSWPVNDVETCPPFMEEYVWDDTWEMGNVLHKSSFYAKGFKVQHLLENYPKTRTFVNEKNKVGMTPLMIAAARGHLKAMAYLYKYDANLEAKDKKKRTAMHWAVWGGNEKAVALLDYLGVNLSSEAKKGLTPTARMGKAKHEHDGMGKLLPHYMRLKKERKLDVKNSYTRIRYPENWTFQGGGGKIFAYKGVLWKLSLHELDKELFNVAGTSGGSIVAALLAVGYTPCEVSKFINGDICRKLKKRKPSCSGFYSLDDFQSWLNDRIWHKTGIDQCTFYELHQERLRGKPYKDLHVFATLNGGKNSVVRFSHENPIFKDTPIANAVAGSCAIPVFISSLRMSRKTENGEIIDLYDEGVFTDGGLLYNNPMTAFDFVRWHNPGVDSKKEKDEKNKKELNITKPGNVAKVNYKTLPVILKDTQEDTPPKNPRNICAGAMIPRVGGVLYNNQDLKEEHEQLQPRRKIEASNQGVGCTALPPIEKKQRALAQGGIESVDEYLKGAELKRPLLAEAFDLNIPTDSKNQDDLFHEFYGKTWMSQRGQFITLKVDSNEKSGRVRVIAKEPRCMPLQAYQANILSDCKSLGRELAYIAERKWGYNPELYVDKSGRITIKPIGYLPMAYRGENGKIPVAIEPILRPDIGNIPEEILARSQFGSSSRMWECSEPP